MFNKIGKGVGKVKRESKQGCVMCEKVVKDVKEMTIRKQQEN